MKGGEHMNQIISFILSVVAGILSHYICKWLDEEE